MFDPDDLKGIIPPIATPLTPAEEVDVGGMRRLVSYLLEAGVHGIFVLGATGEFAYLLKGLALTPADRIAGSTTSSFLPAVEITGEVLGEIGAMIEGLEPLLAHYRAQP